MAIEHVGWEFATGIQAKRHFVYMLEKALEAANIPVYKRTAGWGWIGYYLGKDTGIWTGISYAQPCLLKLAFETAKPDREKFERLGRGEWNGGKVLFTLDLESEGVHFFALSKESQLGELTRFAQQAYADARSCVAVEGEEATPGSTSDE